MDFDPASLFGGLVFSTVGFGAWRYGRKMDSARHMLLGVALFGLPWLLSGGWGLWAVGSALTVGLFWP